MKVFISYAKQDFKIAKKLYADLKKAGVRALLDSEDILPGQDWREGICQAIKESSYFLALLSSNSVSKKGFVQKELRIALDLLQEFPQDQIFIIPARLDKCTPADERLQKLHWVDLFSSYEKGLNQILKVLVSEPNGKKKTSKNLWLLNRMNQKYIVGSVAGMMGLAVAVSFLLFENIPSFSQSPPSIHQNNYGNNNQNIGNVQGNVIIHNTPSSSPGHFLSNSGSPTLIVKEPDLIKATRLETHIGLAIEGTKVELIESKPDSHNPIISWTKIKVLDGELKGKVGWVSTGTVRKQ